MPLERQISVMCPNRAGQLAKISTALAEAGINTLALTVADTTDHAVVRMVTDDWATTQETLDKVGYNTVMTKVLAFELPHKMGALAEAAGKLADAGVNIDYIYGSAIGERSLLIARVSNVKAAEKALE